MPKDIQTSMKQIVISHILFIPTHLAAPEIKFDLPNSATFRSSITSVSNYFSSRTINMRYYVINYLTFIHLLIYLFFAFVYL